MGGRHGGKGAYVFDPVAYVVFELGVELEGKEKDGNSQLRVYYEIKEFQFSGLSCDLDLYSANEFEDRVPCLSCGRLNC